MIFSNGWVKDRVCRYNQFNQSDTFCILFFFFEMENCAASQLSTLYTSWDWSVLQQMKRKCCSVETEQGLVMTLLLSVSYVSNCQANIQRVPKYIWVMNATFEVTHNVFNENEKSNYIQSQVHITKFRLSSANYNLSYIFIPNFSSGAQSSISSCPVDIFSFIHFSTEWLDPIYWASKSCLVSLTFLCLYHWLSDPCNYFSSP